MNFLRADKVNGDYCFQMFPDLGYSVFGFAQFYFAFFVSGFPIVHKHKLACLRQELIDAFVESRYMMFIKYAALQLQQLGLKKQMDIFKETPAKEEAKVVSWFFIIYLNLN